MTQEVSATPSDEQLVAVCHDMLEIFPLLKEPNSAVGGTVNVFVKKSFLPFVFLTISFFCNQDLYYNPDTKKGFLANKFSNQARNNNDSIELNESIDPEEISTDQKKQYADFFRNCVVTKQTKEIKAKLTESARFRRAMMTYFENDFNQICNFYFAMPELVCFDISFSI